jgi:sarcosine oxidase subunit delta
MTEMTDEDFEAFFFLRDNVKGLTFERWRHLNGCGRFFNAARDTSATSSWSYKAGLSPDVSTLRPGSCRNL